MGKLQAKAAVRRADFEGQAAKACLGVDADLAHQRKALPVGARKQVLPVVKPGGRRQRAGPPARALPGLEEMDFVAGGLPGKRDGGGKPGPACADNSNFCHNPGLCRKKQMAIFYWRYSCRRCLLPHFNMQKRFFHG